MAFPIPISLTFSRIDWRWVRETQDEMRKAFALSRKAWPFPSNWKPLVDFGSVMKQFNVSAKVNSTLVQEALNLWLFCAPQYEECACYGTIRWGIEGRWTYIYPASALVANRVRCQPGRLSAGPELPDVSPGDDSKHCECQVNTASSFFNCINAWSLSRFERKKMQLDEAANCNKFTEDMTTQGRLTWQGVDGICDPNSTMPRGAKSLPYKRMTQAMKSYIAGGFSSNYFRLFQDGWLKRAFVSYFGGPLEGKEAQLTELLIESVHRFSVYPIIVFHVGMATPLHWSPRIFPRLVLLSITELPLTTGYSSTLLLAAVISHVETGIFLNYNALVFPGIDELFKAAEREITREYPYPIMPAHFLNKGRDDGGAFWTHVCTPGACARQSMRWSQFGLVWSLHALPFLASTLRGLLRDETYQAKAPYEPLRVRKLHDIESVMNVALWRVKARKQRLSKHGDL